MPDSGSESHLVEVVYALCASIATLTLICRLLARRIKHINLWLDDWIIAAALIFIWAVFVLGFRGISHGLGQHADTIPKDTQALFSQDFYLLQIFYTAAIVSVKLSFLCLYKRMFTGRVFIGIVYVNIVVVAIFSIGAICACIFACFPIYLVWSDGAGYCIASDTFALAFGIIDFATALTIWVLPIPMVWRLRLAWKPKVGVMAVFMLGLTSCAAALARAVISSFALESTDHTWDYVDVFTWSMVEPAIGIICACLPCARITLFALLPRAWRSASDSNTKCLPRSSSLRNSQIQLGWGSIVSANVSHSPKELDTGSTAELPPSEKPPLAELPQRSPRYELPASSADV